MAKRREKTTTTQERVKRQMGRLQESLRKADPDWLSPQAVIEKLARKLDAFYGEAREQAGYRRTPKKAIGVAHKTLKHLVCAVRHAQEHDDGNVRKAAKKLLKSTTHPDVSFEELSQRASKLHGTVRKAGERRANEKREESALLIEVSPRYRLTELTSKRTLRSAGKVFGNCLSDREFLAGYWKEVREGTAELWVLQRKTSDDGWKPRGLLKVDTTGPREIVECERAGNRPLKLKRKVAEAVLCKLRASGDDVETFTRVGAFTAFLDGRPKVEPLQVGQRRVRVWRYPEEIVLKVRRSGGRSKWMRLCRPSDADGGIWDDGIWDDGIWLGDNEAHSTLIDLLLAHPSALENAFPAPGA